MTHSLLLCLEVEEVIDCCGHLDRYSFDDFHTEVSKLIYFIRVVGEKSQLLGPQIFKNLGSDEIFT